MDSNIWKWPLCLLQDVVSVAVWCKLFYSLPQKSETTMQKPELLPIETEETFQFACHSEVSCFNQCCRDLNQALTPYDVLCLKNYLRVSSREFIRTYAVMYTGPSTGLPVVSLRFGHDAERRCPFVTAKGCSVYTARPSSCRIYPLARALRRDRADGRISEHFAVVREPHCRGFEQQKSQTVRQWVANQDLETYLAMNDALMELIALKNQLRPGPLSAQHAQWAQMALYDVEGFRKNALAGELPGANHSRLSPRPSGSDDRQWLQWGLRWISRILFGELACS
jgi:Fe-S-cluster containining protein